MGTYSDEDPNASIPEKIGSSLKKIAQSVLPHAPKYEPASAGNETAQHAADEMSSSNTGPSGQSTDAYNKY
jgi:hypothetical protein